MPAVMACWSRMKTESNPSEGRQKCLPSFCCARLSVQNRPDSSCPRPESLKREDGPDSPLALLLGHQSRSGSVPLIGSPRDFTIVPEDYGRSFPDSGPDAFLAHQRRRTAYQSDFMALIALQKNPLRTVSRGDFQKFVSASCSWRQCRPIPQR